MDITFNGYSEKAVWRGMGAYSDGKQSLTMDFSRVLSFCKDAGFLLKNNDNKMLFVYILVLRVWSADILIK